MLAGEKELKNIILIYQLLMQLRDARASRDASKATEIETKLLSSSHFVRNNKVVTNDITRALSGISYPNSAIFEQIENYSTLLEESNLDFVYEQYISKSSLAFILEEVLPKYAQSDAVRVFSCLRNLVSESAPSFVSVSSIDESLLGIFDESDDGSSNKNDSLKRVYSEILKNISHMVGEVVQEDAATNNASSGEIAGLTGDPPRYPKRECYFAGCRMFRVKPKTFDKFRAGKRKWARWNRYIDINDDNEKEIYDYARKNSGRAIVVQNDQDGAMMYARYKKKGK